MTGRMAKVNSMIQEVVGEILQREVEMPAGSLVTISRVDTAPNLRKTEVWLYILPDGYEEQVMSALKDHMYDIQGAFNREVSLHPLPRIVFEVDEGSRHAAEIDEKLEELKGE